VRCTTSVRHAGHLARTSAAALDPPSGVVAHRSLRRTPRSIAPTRRRGVGHGPRRRACSIPMMPLRSGRGAWKTHHARRRTRTVDCCRELSLDNVIAARRFAHRARTSDPRRPRPRDISPSTVRRAPSASNTPEEGAPNTPQGYPVIASGNSLSSHPRTPGYPGDRIARRRGWRSRSQALPQLTLRQPVQRERRGLRQP
jgi:hypothetical protein